MEGRELEKILKWSYSPYWKVSFWVHKVHSSCCGALARSRRWCKVFRGELKMIRYFVDSAWVCTISPQWMQPAQLHALPGIHNGSGRRDKKMLSQINPCLGMDIGPSNLRLDSSKLLLMTELKGCLIAKLGRKTKAEWACSIWEQEVNKKWWWGKRCHRKVINSVEVLRREVIHGNTSHLLK